MSTVVKPRTPKGFAATRSLLLTIVRSQTALLTEITGENPFSHIDVAVLDLHELDVFRRLVSESLYIPLVRTLRVSDGFLHRLG